MAAMAAFLAVLGHSLPRRRQVASSWRMRPRPTPRLAGKPPIDWTTLAKAASPEARRWFVLASLPIRNAVATHLEQTRAVPMAPRREVTSPILMAPRLKPMSALAPRPPMATRPRRAAETTLQRGIAGASETPKLDPPMLLRPSQTMEIPEQLWLEAASLLMAARPKASSEGSRHSAKSLWRARTTSGALLFAAMYPRRAAQRLETAAPWAAWATEADPKAKREPARSVATAQPN
mmetsp:Transcript_114888/g.324720  ORF Transcript_114888/g.324720 Transcript_114888/m.324720 type:complete len:235 (+) Transcript_114888:137-841(+)